jgi:hypothetical protein
MKTTEIEIIVNYVEAASTLAECVAYDTIKDGKISMKTLDALKKFTQTAQAFILLMDDTKKFN